MTEKRRLSARQRRVRLTAGIITVALVASAAVLAWRYRAATTGVYRPGEANSDITSSLARGLPAEAPKPQFTDVTAAAGLGGFRAFVGGRTSQLPEDMGSGAAWGDFDNDGDEDLFVVSAGGPLTAAPGDRSPSLLYENLGTGQFRAVAGFPDTRILGTGAAFGDVDGDGWIDLVVSGYDTLLLFRNTRGHFAADAAFTSRRGFWTGVAWGDFDRDGDLDLYVCGYVQYRDEEADRTRVSQHYGSAVPFTLNPASYDPERNLLFRNGGKGVFTEVGRALGVSNPDGRSLSAVWHDFDGDGWLDLYVANDISDNVLYRNVRGRFEDISHPAWVADYRGAMGLAVGDWNRDGDDDLFVSHWVAQENALYDSLLGDPSRPSPAVSPAQRAGAAPAPGKAPPVRFVDAADSVGLGQIALPMVGWGAEFADFDADGWLDLAVANGSTFETEATPKKLKPQLPFLFWNRRGEYFHDLAPLVPALATPHVSRGLALADYDNDGDLDVLIVQHDGGVQLLRNDMQRGHWLKVQLRERLAGGPDALGRGLGAQVVAAVGGVRLRRAVSPASYLSQSSSVLHFGLGDKTSIDRLEVRWPDGTTTPVEALGADRTWEITQGSPTARDVSAPVSTSSAPAAAPPPGDARSRTVAFWGKQREAMRVLKVEKDVPRAAGLLREALAFDPTHEDTRYYLASSLARLGDTEGALAQLEELTRINPSSHRGYSRWGALRAQTARDAQDLRAAEVALERAHAVNPEETGALLALGEVSLLRGDFDRADKRLGDACTANPRAAGGLFLLGYIRWKRGDMPHAAELLARTRHALGPEWKPHGSTAEGDVEQKAHDETTPLARFVAEWTGSNNAVQAYAPLDRYLRESRRSIMADRSR
jgi:tetratricopeptide (TPR) repeat protein